MAGRAAARIALPAGLVVLARVIVACLVYLIALDAISVAGYAVGQTVVPELARGTFGLVALGLAEAAALGSVLLVWRLVDRRPLAALGLRNAQTVRRWLKGAAVALGMMGFIVVVNFTLVDGASWDVNTDPLRAAAALLGGLVGFAIQGSAEEALFRGYILVNLREQWGLRVGVAVSSLTFALVHVDNPAFGVLPFVNLLLFGLGAALYRLWVDDDQLWGVFAIHAMWNWLQQVVFGLPNSGFAAVPDYTLFTVMPVRDGVPAVIWGGGFGPEGTLAASLVLLALIGACLRLRRRRASRRAPQLRRARRHV